MATYDIHHHLLMQVSSTAADLAKDYEKRVEIMDRNEIDKAVMLPGSGYFRPRGVEDTKRINDLMAEYVSIHEDRFPTGIGVVETMHGEASLEEIDRIVGSLGLKGVTWHHMNQGAHVNHPMMFRYLERLKELQVPAYIHGFSEYPQEGLWRLEHLAESFPAVTIVALSTLCSWSQIEHMIRILKRCDNIYVDTLVFPIHLWIETIVEEVGAHRVLFGSDLAAVPKVASYHHSASLYEIRMSDVLTAEQKSLILAENAKQLLGMG